MWDFRRFVPKIGNREKGQVGDHLSKYVITPFPVQSEPGLTPIQEWCFFSLPFTPLSSTPLKSFTEPEMEGFSPSSLQMSLQDAMYAECQDITAEQYKEGKGIPKDSSQDALPEKISGGL